MRKRLYVWLSLLLALCLTACGGAAGVSGDAPTESPDLLDVARTARALFDDAQDGGETAALRHIAALQEQGVTAEFCLLENEAQAREYAARRGISRIDIIGDNTSAESEDQ